MQKLPFPQRIVDSDFIGQSCWRTRPAAVAFQGIPSGALRIATDLSLPVLRGDALAARGQIDVLDSRDADAVDPLSTACAIFRETSRRPRLVLALCDYARACYYSGSVNDAEGALNEAHALAERFPGLRPPVLASQMELFDHQGQRDVAFELATELLEAATEAKHRAWIRRATRAIERLKPAGDPTE